MNRSISKIFHTKPALIEDLFEAVTEHRFNGGSREKIWLVHQRCLEAIEEQMSIDAYLAEDKPPAELRKSNGLPRNAG